MSEVRPAAGVVQRCRKTVCVLRLFTLCRDNSSDNSRERTIKFTLNPDVLPSTVHGFAGYFEAELYKGVRISTLPSTHTPDMHSWFPIFFPLAQPLRLEPAATLALSMWRVASASKVRLLQHHATYHHYPCRRSALPLRHHTSLTRLHCSSVTPCTMTTAFWAGAMACSYMPRACLAQVLKQTRPRGTRFQRRGSSKAFSGTTPRTG